MLLHICCAPCVVYPLKILRNEGFDVTGFFYRHNIHPYSECLRREETLQAYSAEENLRIIFQKTYEIEDFLRNVAFRETDRCRYCYHDRFQSTARVARAGKFDAYTTTLLYSKFQNHDLIRSIGESAGQAVGIPFHYRDFRIGWKEGIETSKRLKLYRQQYCGCIYSEKERFFEKHRRDVS